MSGEAPKSFLWSLQGLVALVFTLVVLAISGALIGYNHMQLTTLTFQDAEEDFQRITNNIRGEISGSLKVAGSVLDTVSLTVNADLPSGGSRKGADAGSRGSRAGSACRHGHLHRAAPMARTWSSKAWTIPDRRKSAPIFPPSAAYAFMLVENHG